MKWIVKKTKKYNEELSVYREAPETKTHVVTTINYMLPKSICLRGNEKIERKIGKKNMTS